MHIVNEEVRLRVYDSIKSKISAIVHLRIYYFLFSLLRVSMFLRIRTFRDALSVLMNARDTQPTHLDCTIEP